MQQDCYIDVDREDVTPTEKVAQVNMALSMVQQGVISKETARKEYVNERNPDLENIRILNEMVYMDPRVIQWRVWAESMRTPCQLTTAGGYAVRHTAAPYYTEVRAQCAGRQVPLDEPGSGLAAAIRSGRLPAFSLVVPNVTNDQHSGCVPCGDRFAARWATRIAASPEYRRGDVAVIVVWDEDDHGGDNRVPMVALSPLHPAGVGAAPAVHALRPAAGDRRCARLPAVRRRPHLEPRPRPRARHRRLASVRWSTSVGDEAPAADGVETPGRSGRFEAGRRAKSSRSSSHQGPASHRIRGRCRRTPTPGDDTMRSSRGRRGQAGFGDPGHAAGVTHLESPEGQARVSYAPGLTR